MHAIRPPVSRSATAPGALFAITIKAWQCVRAQQAVGKRQVWALTRAGRAPGARSRAARAAGAARPAWAAPRPRSSWAPTARLCCPAAHACAPQPGRQNPMLPASCLLHLCHPARFGRQFLPHALAALHKLFCSIVLRRHSQAEHRAGEGKAAHAWAERGEVRTSKVTESTWKPMTWSRGPSQVVRGQVQEQRQVAQRSPRLLRNTRTRAPSATPN